MEREFSERVKRVKDLMEEVQYDMLIVFSDEWRQGNVRYLSNFQALTFFDGNIWSPTIVIAPLYGEPILFVPKFQLDTATQVSQISEVKPINDLTNYLKKASSSDLERVALEGWEILPVSLYEEFKKILKKDLESSNILRKLRRIKSPWETERLEKAGSITDIGMQAAINSIDEGVPEWKIAAEGEKAIRRSGAELSFSTMVGVGADSATPESRPSNKEVKKWRSHFNRFRRKIRRILW